MSKIKKSISLLIMVTLVLIFGGGTILPAIVNEVSGFYNDSTVFATGGGENASGELGDTNKIKVENTNLNENPMSSPATIGGYMSIYLGDAGTSLNDLLLGNLSQSAITSTFANLKFTLKHNLSDIGTVYNGSDVFTSYSGNIGGKDYANRVSAKFSFTTYDFENTYLTIEGAGYVANNINISLSAGKSIKIDSEDSWVVMFPGDLGSLNGSIVLQPDGKIDNIDFSAWLKIYKDAIADTASAENKLNADLTKDGVIDNLDFSLWLTSYKKVLSGGDATPPRISSAVINSNCNTITISFTEAMSVEGLTDINNYLCELDGVRPITTFPAGTTFVSPNSKTVVINLNPALPDSIGIGYNDYLIGSGNLKDISGNKKGNSPMTMILKDTINIMQGTVKATSKTTVQFDVDHELQAIDMTKFSFYNNTTKVPNSAVAVNYVNNNGKATVTVTMNPVVAMGNSSGWDTWLSNSAYILGLDPGAITSSTATVNSSIVISKTYNGAGGYSEDFIPPLLDNTNSRTMDTDGDGKIDHIMLQFSEPMDPDFVSKDKFTIPGYIITDTFVCGTYHGAAPNSGGNYFGKYSVVPSWDSNYGAPASGPGTDGSNPTNERPGVITGNGRFVYLTLQEKTGYTFDTDVKPVITILSGLKDNNGNNFAGMTISISDGAFPVWNTLRVSNNNSTVTFEFRENIKLASGRTIADLKRFIKISHDNGLTFNDLSSDDIVSMPQVGGVGNSVEITFSAPLTGAQNKIRIMAMLSATDISPLVDNNGKDAPQKVNIDSIALIPALHTTFDVTYSTPGPYKQGTVVTITATSSNIFNTAPSIAISGANTLASTPMTLVDATHFTYQYTVGEGNGEAAITISGNNASGEPAVPNPLSGGKFMVDNTAPTVVSAAFTDANHLVITFSEAVNAVASNFTDCKLVLPGGTFGIISASGSGTNTITFTIAGVPAITSGMTGSIDISGVADLAGNAITVADQAISAF